MNSHRLDPKERAKLAHLRVELPTGIRLTRELDKERIALENLLHLRDRAVAAGLPVRHLTYEELNDDHSKLGDIRKWILGEQASDPRCAPDHRNTTLKVHVGPVSSHVANWEAVEETLRGTRYEHFLSE